MGNISEQLPGQSLTTKAIFDYYKKTARVEIRQYLGASQIGHPCERYLWYVFRHCCSPAFDGRIYRLFDTGIREERRLVSDLRAIGCTVHEVDENGEQFRVSAIGGHFVGHLDGCAIGILESPKTWHVLEFKTHNTKSFKELSEKGVKEAKPQHYAQIVCYMHLTGMTRALYIAVCKDNDDIYTERIHWNSDEGKALIARAERIITASKPPERISGNSDCNQCKWCDAKDICWGGAVILPVPSINCRQCCHAVPIMNGEGRWDCKKHKRALTADDQRKACEDHLVLPGLIVFASKADYGSLEGDEWIEFTDSIDGYKWYHGRRRGMRASELTALPRTLIDNKFLNLVKSLFGATVTDYSADDILERYADKSSAIVWKGPASDLIKAWKERYNQDLLSIVPIKKNKNPIWSAVEYMGNRVAVLFSQSKLAEIVEKSVPF